MSTGEQVKICSWPSTSYSGSDIDQDIGLARLTQVQQHGMCPNCGKLGRPEHKRLTLRVLLTCKMPWLFCYAGGCQRPVGCAAASCNT